MADSTPLAVGDRVPDVGAPLVRPDGSAEETPLSELLEERPVLLCFYTNDFAPDCVNEWCSFRDYEWFSTNPSVTLVGASTSRPVTHRKFMDLLDLSFPMYADTDLTIAEAFGVDYRAFRVLARSRRSCFLIDRDRTIRHRWLADHSIDPTMDTPDVGDLHDAVVETFGDGFEAES